MDDCRTLRLWYGNPPALGAVRRRGSILLVPVLHLLFPQCAVQVLAATSLTVVMLSALINVCAFWRQGSVKYATAGALVAGDGDGNAGGRVRQLLLSDKVLLMLFALVLVGLALRCGYSRQTPRKRPARQPDAQRRDAAVYRWRCCSRVNRAGRRFRARAADVAALRIPRQHIAVYCNWMMLFGSAGTVVSYLYRTAPDTGALPPVMQFVTSIWLLWR
ncbi:sulfite exporter TauE/SafE family protein [Salmonella enterica subsp. enterica serovar Senftenberg]|nr:sulfite exporter TauE/SafE family protein [Salmonella enterica subsp. enterica serovar Senftenberg]